MANLFGLTLSTGSDGANATTGNTGADFVSATPPKVSTTRAVDGTRSLLIDTASASAYCYWNHSSETMAIYDMWVWLDATPATTLQLAYIATQSAGTNLADLRIQTSGKVQVRNNFASEWVSTTTLTAGKWWHIRWIPGSATGKMRVLIFDGNATTATEDTDNLAAGSRPDYTGGAWDRFHAGATATATAKFWLDRTYGDDATGTGPVTSAPTITMPANRTMQDTHTTSLDATVSGNTGTTTYAWTVASGPSTSPSQFSAASSVDTDFTPSGGAGTYVLRLSVTDDSGTHAGATDVSVIVTALTNTHTVASVISSSGYSAAGGAASVTDALVNGVGYIVVTDPSSADLKYQMTGCLPPGPGVDYVHSIPARRNGGSSGTEDVSLLKPDGSTLVKKATGVTLPSGATRDPVAVTFAAADITGLSDADWKAGVVVLREPTTA